MQRKVELYKEWNFKIHQVLEVEYGPKQKVLRKNSRVCCLLEVDPFRDYFFVAYHSSTLRGILANLTRDHPSSFHASRLDCNNFETSIQKKMWSPFFIVV